MASKFTLLLAAALAVVIGGMDLAGWALDIAVLKSIRPDWVAMKPNTALAFILIGWALWLQPNLQPPSVNLQPFRLRLARLCALLAGLIGLLTLLEYAGGWNPGFDQWLFPEPAGAVGTSHPGRMAPEAALCFALLAAALWITSGSRPTRRALLAAALCGLLVTTLAVAALLCYFTPALGAFGWWGLTIMAVPTSATFVVLGLAVIAIVWQPGVLSWSLDGKTTMAFVGGLALLVFIGLNTNRTLVQMEEIDDRITRTEQVLHISSHILAELTKAQSSTRNYVITGDERLAESYLAAAARSRQELAGLRRLTAADPQQQQRITRLETQIKVALQWWRQTIDTRRAGGVGTGIQRTLAGDGLALLDNLTAHIEQMQDRDRLLFRELQQESEGVARLSFLIISAGTLTSLVLFLAVLFGLNRAVSRRQRAEKAILKERDFNQLVITSAGEGICVCHEIEEFPHVRFSIWNEYMTVMTGYSMAEINRLGWYQSLYPDPAVQERAIARMQCMRAGDNLQNEEWEITRSDGQKRQLLISTRLLRGGEGPGQVLAVMNDITERKRAEATRETLLALETRLSAAATPREAAQTLFAAADQLWDWDSGTLDLYSPAADRTQAVLYLDLVEGARCEVAATPSPVQPTPRCRRILEQGAELILRQPPYVPLLDSVMFGDTSRPSASIMCVPVRWQGRLAGILSIQSYRPNAFTGEDLRMLQGLADHCGGALERLQAQETLRESESRFRNLVETTGDFIWEVDAKGVYTYASPQIRDLLGYEPAEVLGKTPFDFMPPEEAKRIEAIFAPLTKANEPFTNLVNTNLHKDGHPVVLETSGVPIIGPDGKASGCRGIDRDITERQQTKARLYLQSAALESAANAIVITDRSGTIIWTNPAFTQMTGYAVEEAVGQNPRLLKSGQQDQALYRTLWETILAGNVWHGELRNQRKDGSVYDEDMTIAPVKDAQGQVTHFIAIKQDITEKRNLEKRMLRAQRMESVGQLAGGIAHDLNNVLSPILMATQLLREGLTDPESEKYRAIIETSAKRGADIVKQVLTFSRGVQGERVALQPRHLVKEITRLIRDTFPKDIRIEASLPDDLWQVRGDATQIHQVLMNFCVNARDAMPRGGLLRLMAQNQVVDETLASMIPGAQPGQYVTLTVSDTGTGMAPAVMDRMFEPFFTTKAQGRGTGLGLATTFGIVKSHGGFLQVASEIGRGSQFIVFLPAVIGTETAADKGGSDLPPRGRGEGILIVDDEQAIREVAARILTQHGYQVLAAADGEEGVVQFVQHRHKIALVISDLMMPGMDGLAMSRAILRLDPAAKIVISTGLMVGSDIEPKVAELKEMGITRFLAKPYPRDVLLAEIHKALHPGAEERRRDA